MCRHLRCLASGGIGIDMVLVSRYLSVATTVFIDMVVLIVMICASCIWLVIVVVLV